MGYIDIDSCEVFVGEGEASAPVIYVIDAVEHPFGVGELAKGRVCTLSRVAMRDWNDTLTPWPAPGLRRGDAGFGGRADATLGELVERVIPAIEREHGLSPARRAICGYSLAGLFALYALVNVSAIDACACLSGSVWYEGWVEYLRDASFDGDGRFVFLSVGAKEKRARQEAFKTVEANMGECAQILRERGCEVEFTVGPGGHMDHHRERFDAGLTALEARLLS